MYTANAIRNICLLGHSGSGKTALAESLLYMTGMIDRIGKNADGNTVCARARLPYRWRRKECRVWWCKR